MAEMPYLHQGQAPSTLVLIKHELGDALNDLWNFLSRNFTIH